MKILMINKFHYLRGGSERYVFELTKLLEAKGHKVMHFSMADKKNYYSKFSPYFIKPVYLNKFNIINIIKYFYNYEAVKKLKKLIKSEKPDLAHLHNIAGQISPAIIKVLKKHKIPIVQTLHDYKLICPNAKLFSGREICYKCRGGKYYNCFFRKCLHNSRAKSFLGMIEAYLNNKILKYYNAVDLFIAPSQFMKDICVKFGLPESKIKLCYNFIDVKIDDVEDIAVANNPNYLLYFGRLSPEKGIDILLEAIKKLNHKIRLKIAGTGPEYKNLELLIAKYKLNNQVELLGSKSEPDLKKVIKQARAIVMPSLWPENMPYSLLESLALVKIIIASRIGGIVEVIKDGWNGFLFARGDSAGLAKKIGLILADNQLAKILENNVKHSLEKFNSQDHYQEIIKIYQNLL